MKSVIKAFLIILAVIFAVNLLVFLVKLLIPLAIIVGIVYLVHLIITKANDSDDNDTNGNFLHRVEPDSMKKERFHSTMKNVNDFFRAVEIEYAQYEANPITGLKIQELLNNKDKETEKFFVLLDTTRSLVTSGNDKLALEKENKDKKKKSNYNYSNELTKADVTIAENSLNELRASWGTVKSKIM